MALDFFASCTLNFKDVCFVNDDTCIKFPREQDV